jgi:NADH-quinone oxidoreductase subunit N
MFSPITLEILVLVLGFVLLLAESFSNAPSKRALPKIALLVLFWVFAFSFFAAQTPDKVEAGSFWNFYSASPISMLFKQIALLTTMCVIGMSLDYESTLAKFIPSSRPGAGTGEFYILPLFTCAGLMLMASATDLVMAFAALELVTISFYVQVAYMRSNSASLEAGVKYLILGALSTGFFVYGLTWIFGLTGETHFDKVALKLAALQGSDTAILFALLLVLVGLGFKVAAVPFHSWVPDVYQGAPTPVTAFLSVGSKAAGFLLALRVLEPFLGVSSIQAKVLAILGTMAGATLIYGNLAALPQNNLKRLLAYSSIGHAGYLLLAIASVGAGITGFGTVGTTVGFYLFAYLLMTILGFMVLTTVSTQSKGEEIQHFNGLSKRSPFLAFALLVAMSSLAGVPLTAGFYGKFLVFAHAVNAQLWVLVGIGFVTVGAGFYYYLRVVAAMYWYEPTDTTPIQVSPLSKMLMAALVVSIFLFGVNPRPVLSALQGAPAKTAAAY